MNSISLLIRMVFWTLPLAGLLAFQHPCAAQEGTPPNILWLTSEDNSPLMGCYGDELATTPYLDGLAKQGFLYTHAYANAPVCAPSRNTIITGVYANAGGHENMRSYYTQSALIRLLPEYLRSAGYYCTNNSKEDYNLAGGSSTVWDESSAKAHYKNRKPGQPFFAVFNCMISHESCLHKPDSGAPTRHDPTRVQLPPYHPDTRIIGHDWARYYDCIEKMDAWVGEKLRELEAAGLADNTIVIYYADHGGVLARSKRYVYETGTRIPFIIRIPRSYSYLYPATRPGSQVDRLISLVDLLPTMLSIAGMAIPDYLQGHAFLGAAKTPPPQYVYMFRGRMDERIDMSRAVRDSRYRYIRNYMAYRIYGQHIDYLWKAPSMRSWEAAYESGMCDEIQSRFFRTKPVEELYDTKNDPWEVNNLAGDTAYRQVLSRMSKASEDWMRRIGDAGLLPEGMISRIAQTGALYEYMRSGAVDVKRLLAVSDLANFAGVKDIPRLEKLLTDSDEAVRYWAACGLLQLGKAAAISAPALLDALGDPSLDVAITAAEAVYGMGMEHQGLSVLLGALRSEAPMIRLHALNALDNSCRADETVLSAVSERLKAPVPGRTGYEENLMKWILQKKPCR